MEEFATVSFLAPKSFVNISFWEELYNRKLDMYGLSNEQIPLRAFLSPSEGENVSALTVDKESFEGGFYSVFMSCVSFTLFHSSSSSSDQSSTTEVSIRGSLLNVNTIQAFKDIDKKSLIDNVGCIVRDAVESQKYLKDPSMLQRFVLLTFADLKGAELPSICKYHGSLLLFINIFCIIYFPFL